MFVEINFSFLISVTYYHYPARLDVQKTHASITLGNSYYFCAGKQAYADPGGRVV
jgi:hypothetical protein